MPKISVTCAGNFALQRLPEVHHRASVKTNVTPHVDVHTFRLCSSKIAERQFYKKRSTLVSFKRRTELDKNTNEHRGIRCR